MGHSCCICGALLASQELDRPGWCKAIRAVYRLNGEVGSNPCLSGNGWVDEEDIMPFQLRISSDDHREFCYRSGPTGVDQALPYCYPFHVACWNLLQEVNGGEINSDGVTALFDIFEGFHYDENARCLKWGHNYFFEDILDPCHEGDIIDRCKAHDRILQDPSSFTLGEGLSMKLSKKYIESPSNPRPESSSNTGEGFRLLSLPPEVFLSILCYLDFRNAQCLLAASRWLYHQYGGGCALPVPFWQTVFSGDGEAAFAKPILQVSGYWGGKSNLQYLESFFVFKSLLEKGPNRWRLQNRKRIWRIGVALMAMIRSISERSRVLCGSIVEPLPQHTTWAPTACSLALGDDSDGCRELKQVCAPLNIAGPGSRLCAVLPTYTFVSSRRLISGITFVFRDGALVDAGYVVRPARVDGTPGIRNSEVASSNSLWLVFSRFGLEAISLSRPPELVQTDCVQRKTITLGIARWRCDNSLGRICLGLDAMRIVRIYGENIPKNRPQDILRDALWEPPYPTSAPVLHKADIAALHKFQQRSFVPASIMRIEPENGPLTAIHVYSQLGFRAGINGMRFVYNKGRSTLWGCATNAASLSFFIDEAEILVGVSVYKDSSDSQVQHVQFTTNTRTSDPIPLLPPGRAFLRVDYTASSDGHITGLCGCFVSSRRLHCLGVLATPSVNLHARLLQPRPEFCELLHFRRGIGGIQSHGEHRSKISLEKRYRSIRACINPTSTNYRAQGSIIGLLFLPRKHGLPTLLGQWSDTGQTYALDESEQILDLRVLTTRPKCEMECRPTSTQVASIAVVTSARTICLGNCAAEVVDNKTRAAEIVWHFNAIFDHVDIRYELTGEEKAIEDVNIA